MTEWGKVEWFQEKARRQGTTGPLAYFGHRENAFQKLRHEWIAGFVKDNLPPGIRSLVDFGCGTGELTYVLREVLGCIPAKGTDFLDDLIMIAQERYPEVMFSLNALPAIIPPPVHPGLAVFSEVLYYLDEPERLETLKNLRTVFGKNHGLLLSSAIGTRYFTPDSARELLEPYYNKIIVSTLTMPRYKRLYGIIMAFGSICSQAKACAKNGTNAEKRVVKIVAKILRVPLGRALIDLVDFMARCVIRSTVLAKISKKIENDLKFSTQPSNMVVLAWESKA